MSTPAFALTSKQQEAMRMLRGPARHLALIGGSRSAKTFTILRAQAIRALKAPHSHQAAFRFRFNHAKSSLVYQTWPKVHELCFPGIPIRLDKSDWFLEFPNGSHLWFGGLDEKERIEKILGQEQASIFLNECSQISWAARNTCVTRLAQKVEQNVGAVKGVPLSIRMYYDYNPPKKSHWTHHLFERKMMPGTLQQLPDPDNYARLVMNPADNAANLPPETLEELQNLPERERKRFWAGEYGETAPGALWDEDVFAKWRVMGGELPDMQRIVVAVDPSGADDEDNAGNDEIGITVCALGVDGNGYLLEDLTLKAGPETWGQVAATAYERHAADRVVGETNFGGAMVEFVVKTAKPDIPFTKLTASRGKVQRAEPIAALYPSGRIRHVGHFPELEGELCDFTTTGYKGSSSPNRGDAAIWGFSELFPGIAKGRRERKSIQFAPWGG